eukprot:scaffold2082_cov110-Skeletonema_dohrnii-CCMP3373.AAC.1
MSRFTRERSFCSADREIAPWLTLRFFAVHSKRFVRERKISRAESTPGSIFKELPSCSFPRKGTSTARQCNFTKICSGLTSTSTALERADGIVATSSASVHNSKDRIGGIRSTLMTLPIIFSKPKPRQAMKMKVPTFIKKITAKTNSRCSKSDSSDNEAAAAAAAAAGLYRESEKEELNSTHLHLPVVERDSQSPLKLNDDEFNNVKKFEPSQSSPSRSLVLEGGVTTTTGQCPFKHGTVYSGPYPGYAHGNPKRGICPNGCRAEMTGDSDMTDDESTAETMMREAMEYLELYYHERSEDMSGTKGFLPKEERMAQVREAIHETATYAHTFDELEHGARVAWRNAPKCSNRKYWQQLKLLDCRNVDTNEGMFGSCIKHLTKAVACGSAEAYVT